MTAPTRSPFDRAAAHNVGEPFGSFNLAGVLDPVDVRSAVTIGRIFEENNPDVLLAAAMVVRGTRFGHVCVDLHTIRDTVTVDGVRVEVVDGLAWPDPAVWLDAVTASQMTGNGQPDRPLVVHEGLLYLERFWNYEQRVIAQIRDRLDDASSVPIGTGVLDRLFPEDDVGSMQRTAAENAARGRFTVIAGGPGTGKTYTVAKLIAALFESAFEDGRSAPSVAVAAPTGKAAARLTEQIRITAAEVETTAETHEQMASMEAATLHRLLGWHPARGKFRHRAENPLPHDMVIVDEMSMVPLTMTAKLLEAIHPETSVVMVGDPDQLVSIEAGTVLGDLVAAGTQRSAEPASALVDHVVTLERVFRFERTSPIGDLARAIRSGSSDAAIELLADGADGIRWFDPSEGEVESADEFTEPIVTHARRLISMATAGDVEGALTAVGRLAVLCAHRRGDHGVQHWGPWIEQRAREGTGSYEAWYPGRPVMVLSNDYRLGVFNGDIGVTVMREGALTVAFPGPDGPRFVGPAQLPAIETVHAMTIHKSQGSQFEETVVLIPGEESRLLTRELLYTAVTRAEERVTVVGSEAAIRAAIGRQVERASGLTAGLIRHD